MSNHFKKRIWGGSSNHLSGVLRQRHLELYKVLHKHNPTDYDGKKYAKLIGHCQI